MNAELKLATVELLIPIIEERIAYAIQLKKCLLAPPLDHLEKRIGVLKEILSELVAARTSPLLSDEELEECVRVYIAKQFERAPQCASPSA